VSIPSYQAPRFTGTSNIFSNSSKNAKLYPLNWHDSPSGAKNLGGLDSKVLLGGGLAILSVIGLVTFVKRKPSTVVVSVAPKTPAQTEAEIPVVWNTSSWPLLDKQLLKDIDDEKLKKPRDSKAGYKLMVARHTADPAVQALKSERDLAKLTQNHINALLKGGDLTKKLAVLDALLSNKTLNVARIVYPFREATEDGLKTIELTIPSPQSTNPNEKKLGRPLRIFLTPQEWNFKTHKEWSKYQDSLIPSVLERKFERDSLNDASQGVMFTRKTPPGWVSNPFAWAYFGV
jgi:hypothetical protein